jgi:quinohemoprotein amine dehydrogenase
MRVWGRVSVVGKQLTNGLLFFLLSLGVATQATAQENGDNLVMTRCITCHQPKDGKVDVLAEQRKTPEGWEMTLMRMVRTYGAKLTPDELRTLVKYLSDTYGLAPAEVEPFRYILEKRNNLVVSHDIPKMIQASCMQCHSYERVALQRRSREMWDRMPDTKLALFTNTENVTASSGLLTDYWYTEAKQQVVPYLARQYPLTSAVWTKWHAKAKPDYAGTWKIVGHDAGKGGDYTGQILLNRVGEDRYEGDLALDFSDGTKITGKTTGMIYTGFQWRGSTQLEGGKTQREIFFATEDGMALKGRRLLTPVGDLGMDETWYKSREKARLLLVSPEALQVGKKQRVKIFGVTLPQNLAPTAVNLGAGVQVQSLTQSGDDTIMAEVEVTNGAAVGVRQGKIQGTEGSLPLHVYRAIDYIRLSPETAFARPGGEHAPKVFQQFEAFAYLNGPDGVKGTKDDVKLHRVGPVKWNLNEYVKRLNDDDVHFVGTVDDTGLFMPAKDGPNPQRHMMDHNVGDVWVEGWYTPEGAKRPMGARAYLLVMPEKFNFQPID